MHLTSLLQIGFQIQSATAQTILCRGVTRVSKSSGCALSGFVLVKKVPGTMHFLAKSPGHSFDHVEMNMSHVVHYLYAGNKPSPRRRKVLPSPNFLLTKNDQVARLVIPALTSRMFPL